MYGVNVTCSVWISKPSFHLILNNPFLCHPLSSACGLSNQSLPVSYAKKCCACRFWFLDQNDLQSLSSRILNNGATSEVRRDTKSQSKNHMRRPSGLILFWRFSFAVSQQTALYDIYSVKHVLSSIDVCSEMSESSFHPPSCLSLGACGEYSVHFFEHVSFPESRQHVKELLQRVRNGERKMSLACMKHWPHLN